MYESLRRTIRYRYEWKEKQRETGDWLLQRVREGMIDWCAFRQGRASLDPKALGFDWTELDRAYEIASGADAVRLYLKLAGVFEGLPWRERWRRLWQSYRRRVRGVDNFGGETMRRALYLMAEIQGGGR